MKKNIPLPKFRVGQVVCHQQNFERYPPRGTAWFGKIRSQQRGKDNWEYTIYLGGWITVRVVEWQLRKLTRREAEGV